MLFLSSWENKARILSALPMWMFFQTLFLVFALQWRWREKCGKSAFIRLWMCAKAILSLTFLSRRLFLFLFLQTNIVDKYFSMCLARSPFPSTRKNYVENWIENVRENGSIGTLLWKAASANTENVHRMEMKRKYEIRIFTKFRLKALFLGLSRKVHSALFEISCL